MLVKAIASTQIDFAALEGMGYIPHHDLPHPEEPEMFLDKGNNQWLTNPEWLEWSRNTIPREIDELHEIGGRRCYCSWHRPNPKTATNKGYLANILDTEHYSVVAHGHVTFRVEGVSRALLLELERHQKKSHLNFSVVSQRYVDHSEANFVIPPLLEEHLDEPLFEDSDWTVADELADIQVHGHNAYVNLTQFMERKGYAKKPTRGAVRGVLPENTETQFIVTASIRGWRDVLEQRLSETADEEIRLFALEILRELIRLAPNSVQDYARDFAIELGEE